MIKDKEKRYSQVPRL